MSLSDLSKQLDDRKSSNKEQPYSMGRQTVRKARPDLTDKDFQASIKLKTAAQTARLAFKWLDLSTFRIRTHIGTHPIPRYSRTLGHYDSTRKML